METVLDRWKKQVLSRDTIIDIWNSSVFALGAIITIFITWPRHITFDLIALAHSTVGALPSLRSDRHIDSPSEWVDLYTDLGENKLIGTQIRPDIGENLPWDVIPIAEIGLFTSSLHDHPRNCQLT